MGKLKEAIDSQCDALTVSSWKDILPNDFKYPQTAVIRNKVIASTNKFLQLGIIIFFAYLFFVDEQYMMEYVPYTRGKFYPYPSNYTDWDELLQNGSEPSYCNNSDYNWIYSDYYQYIEATCVQPKFYEVFLPGETSIFFFTYFTETTFTEMPCEEFNYTECVQDYSQNYTSKDSLNVTCRCETLSSHFTVGVEDINLAVEHSYSVALVGLGGKSGEMMTVIRDVNGVEVAIPEGDIVYSIGQWISWAGISLDDFNTETRDYSWPHPSVPADATYPTIRVTGSKILLDVKYYNMPKYQPKWHSSSTVAYIDVSAVLQWESRASNVRYIDYPEIVRWGDDTDVVYSTYMKLVNRYGYGLTFIISGSGFIGEFDIMAVKTQLVDIICLIGYIPVFMSVIAMSFFGFKSVIFKGQLSHGMDGEMKEKEKFRKTFKYLFKNYWTSSYTLTFEQFHQFCCDRDVPLTDEEAMREECIFMSSRKNSKVITATLLFMALQDPDPDGTIDRYWDYWAEEYMRMKQELHKKKLAAFQLKRASTTAEGEKGRRHSSSSSTSSHTEEIANWSHVHKSRQARGVREKKPILGEKHGKKPKNVEQEENEMPEKEVRQRVPKTKPEPTVDPKLKAVLENLTLNNIVQMETLKSKQEEIRTLRRNLRESGLKVKAAQERSVEKLEDFLGRVTYLEGEFDSRASHYTSMSLSLVPVSSNLKTSFVSPRSFYDIPLESRDAPKDGSRKRVQDSSSRDGTRTPIKRISSLSSGFSSGRL